MRRSGLVALGLAASLVASADPAKTGDKAKNEKKAPPPPTSNEPGRSKRAAAEDYDPASAPTRLVGTKNKKVLVLAEITIEGRIAKPGPVIEAVSPPGPLVAIPDGVPTDVVAAIEALRAVDGYARARERQWTTNVKRDPALDARWATAARDVVDSATRVLDPAAIRAVLAKASDADRGPLAYELLRLAPSLELAVTVLCGPDASPARLKTVADLDACTAKGIAPTQAAFAWLELGHDVRVGGQELSEHAFARAVQLGSPPVAAVAAYYDGDALFGLDRLDDSARLFDNARQRAVAIGDAIVRENALQWTAIVLATDRDGQIADAKATLARVDSFFGRTASPIRATVVARIGSIHHDNTDWDGTVTLLRAALALTPLAPEAPRWHAEIVQALVEGRQRDRHDAEVAAFDAAYREGTAWWASNKGVPEAMSILAAATASTRAPSNADIDDPGMDEAEVRRIVDQHRAALHRCLAGSSGESVLAILHLEIDSRGAVTSATVHEAPPEVGACIVELVKSWTFPRPDDSHAHADLTLRLAR